MVQLIDSTRDERPFVRYTPTMPSRLRAHPPRPHALAAIVRAHEHCDRALALARDPVQFPRRFRDREDREVAAILSALLAFGNVETIRAKLAELFDRLGPSPARAARDWTDVQLDRAMRGFRHRTFRGADIARLVVAMGVVLRRDGTAFGTLDRAFRRSGNLRDALAAWVAELRALAWPRRIDRAARHLLPDPMGPSACKRLALLARWVVRPDDGVDLGLVAIPTSALVIPLDVHVHRVARALRLTRRASASWAAAEEVTNALRHLDPDDPVRFDFAVCHVEIEASRARRRRVAKGTRSPTDES
jgi:uncharacterized protein (TIGR02757 family)